VKSNLHKVPVEQVLKTRTEGEIRQMHRNVQELHKVLIGIKVQMIKDGRLKIINGNKVWSKTHCP